MAKIINIDHDPTPQPIIKTAFGLSFGDNVTYLIKPKPIKKPKPKQ